MRLRVTWTGGQLVTNDYDRVWVTADDDGDYFAGWSSECDHTFACDDCYENDCPCMNECDESGDGDHNCNEHCTCELSYAEEGLDCDEVHQESTCSWGSVTERGATPGAAYINNGDLIRIEVLHDGDQTSASVSDRDLQIV